MNSSESKQKRYTRVTKQLEELFSATDSPIARMATTSSLLYHKLKFFWIGFYILDKGDLIVGPYQGSLACLKLKHNEGVCWKCVRDNQPIIVPNVHEFPGHIACDSRSQSEIVVPVTNAQGDMIAVLDVDSDNLDTFDQTDCEMLQKIAALIYNASEI